MIEFNEPHRQKLIIAADDFGVSPSANRNILHLISLGKISRVGIMANGKISAEEINELVYSGVKLDIHLDILHQFHDDRKYRQGTIGRSFEFLTKLATGKISSKKVAREWENQIKKFRELFGKNPDGINSHEHVHFFPPFFTIVLILQQKCSIPYIRFGNSLSLRHHAAVAYILNCMRLFNRRKFLESGCVSSESFISLDWIDNVDAFMDNLPEGTIEIACHPELAEDFEKIKKYF